MNDVYALGALIALLVGLLAVAAMAISLCAALHLASRFRNSGAYWILGLVALMGAVENLFSGRRLDIGNELLVQSFAANRWPLRTLTALLIGTFLVVVIDYGFRSDDARPNRAWRAESQRGILLGVAIYFVTYEVLPSIFGYKPLFDPSQYYPVVAFLALLSFGAPQTLEDAGKFSLQLVLLLSLVGMLVWPKETLQTGYTGLIPGFSIRLWGAASHANVLAPIALTFLWMEGIHRYRQPLLHWVTLFMAISVLILTQSKTAWIAGIAGICVVVLYRALFLEDVRARWFAASVVLAVLLTVGGALFLSETDGWHQLARDIGSHNAEELLTLTGRNEIWSAAFDTAWAHPLFGYGLRAWDFDFRNEVGMPFAFHAHNQLLQVASVGGLVGLGGFLVYSGVLFVAAFKAARSTGGVSLALLAMLAVRSLSEAPMAINVVSSGDFLVHLTVVCVLLSRAGKRAEEPAHFEYSSHSGAVRFAFGRALQGNGA